MNDTVGHHGGDELLREVAKRFLGQLQSAGSLARVGGDEFTVIMEGSPSRSAVEDVIAMLHKSLTKPVSVRGHMKVVSASIGAAYSPEDGETHDSLYALADLNMYQLKHAGDAPLLVP